MAATVVVFSFLRDGDQVCKSEQGGECAQRGGTILSALSNVQYCMVCYGGRGKERLQLTVCYQLYWGESHYYVATPKLLDKLLA